MSAVLINDLREAGLLNDQAAMLPEQGRERPPESGATETDVAEDWAADLVLSVNGLSR